MTLGLIESFTDKAQDLVDWVYEYETTHQDAGGGYAHLPSEGDFDYYNGESRLTEYCKENGIDLTGIEIDKLAEDVIFWSYMTPGYDFDPKGGFLVSAFPVGEIETQVSTHDIGARFTQRVIDHLNANTDAYWNQGRNPDEPAFVYISAHEKCWDCICDLDQIKNIVEQMKESAQ